MTPRCLAPDVGLPAPDVVIYLDLPIDEAEKRGGFGSERYEKREMQVKVYQDTKRSENANVVCQNFALQVGGVFQKLKTRSWKVDNFLVAYG